MLLALRPWLEEVGKIGHSEGIEVGIVRRDLALFPGVRAYSRKKSVPQTVNALTVGSIAV